MSWRIPSRSSPRNKLSWMPNFKPHQSLSCPSCRNLAKSFQAFISIGSIFLLRSWEGDLFQVTPWGTDHLGLMILDMSGHGMGPALRAISLSMMFQSANIAQRFPSYEPSEIVRALNKENPITEQGRVFYDMGRDSSFAHARVAVCHCGTSRCHLDEVRGRTHRRWGAKPCRLGFTWTSPMTPSTSRYFRMTVSILFSDGIYEVMSPDEQLWGCGGLEEACRIVHKKPLGKALSWIIQQSKGLAKTRNVWR